VRHHHERTDGTGYPDGIAGGDIPVGARIIAVADTFDAITSTRAYRKPRTHKQALEVLEQEAGTQLDELAVAAFVSYYAAHRSVELATVLAVAPQRLLSGLGGVQSGVAAGVAPIAQTACGIGGVALIGACLGGPMPASDSSASHDTAHRQFAAQTGKPATGSGPTSQSRRAGGRSHARRDGPGSDNRSRLSTSPREKSSAPRALETPVTDTPSEDQGGSGGGGGGGGSGGGVSLPIVPPSGPSLPAIPAVPDVQDVLDPVTDGVTGTPQLKLPQLGLP
jgi:hypothetical protein